MILRHPCKEIQRLMIANNFEMIRKRKHAVYKHRDTGRIVTVSLTPSDRKAIYNIRATVKRVLNN